MLGGKNRREGRKQTQDPRLSIDPLVSVSYAALEKRATALVRVLETKKPNR